MSEMLTMMAQAPQVPFGKSLETGAFVEANRIDTSPIIDGFVGTANELSYQAGRVAKPMLRTAAVVGVAATPAIALGTGEAPAPQPTVTYEAPTLTYTAATAAARSVARADLSTRVVLSYRSATGTPRAEIRRLERSEEPRCHIDTDIWNSGTRLGENRNNPTFFRDTGKLTVVCASKTSPTGEVKVGIAKNRNVLKDGFQSKKDIVPGTDCWNIVKSGTIKKPRKVVHNPIMVRSFNEKVNLAVAARANARVECAPGTFAEAAGLASASTRISIAAILRSRGVANGSFVADVKGKAGADAEVKVSCASTTTTPGKATVDLCPNYPGDQSTIPVGSLLGPDGMCGKDPNYGEPAPGTAPGPNVPNDPTTPPPSECFGPDGLPATRGSNGATCEA